ncbi:dnaJ homolog subfamily C member 17 [Caerostris extrusa]|uniref:DnaJ homolog subfamily C member 17 n=1 Tax=Caerostris extrusa TaxID=172846 RepID=A0AAV4XC46_CAEEX|nr:dnaJ homolog subfamily C member 17 [Caerostris extrusa]
MYISLLFFLSDLEARERAASDQEFDKKKSAEDLQKEIERLRKEGSRLVEEEKERLRQEILKQRSDIREVHTERKSQEQPRLKVKWKIHKLDESHGGYNQEYGKAICFVSTKKKGSAIVEFSTATAAQMAFELEKGEPDNPLTLSWICGQPEIPNNSRFTSQPNVKGPVPEPSGDSALTSRDYESLVLMKLRQAEERKKLIQQMMEEED